VRTHVACRAPDDLTVEDIQEFIALFFVREEDECKEREAALVRDEARVAEIRASQTANDALTTVIYVAAGAIWRLARTGGTPSLRQG
jgi:hypothetical protein